VLWPVALAAVDGASNELPGAAAPTESVDASPRGEKTSSSTPTRYRDIEEGLHLLPPYARSLLKIPVPVTVTLAEAKQPLRAILNMGPGSIIHFSKSCEDTLTLEVSGHKLAVGETVKVGDKFGLWITSIVMPDERFFVIGNRQPAVRAK
jgi:flagellar motor switch protein FliN/FliY